MSNLKLTVDAFSSKLAAWDAELKAGTDVMTHGAQIHTCWCCGWYGCWCWCWLQAAACSL